MAEGLEQAAGERWTTTDELLRTLILRTDLVYRQLFVSAGNEDPGPIEVLRPGESKPRQGMASMARRLLRGR